MCIPLRWTELDTGALLCLAPLQCYTKKSEICSALDLDLILLDDENENASKRRKLI